MAPIRVAINGFGRIGETPSLADLQTLLQLQISWLGLLAALSQVQQLLLWLAGRLAAREIVGQDDLQLVHINDVCAVESAAYLLKYDSVHGERLFQSSATGCAESEQQLSVQRVCRDLGW